MTMTPTTNALTVTSVFYDGIFQAVNLYINISTRPLSRHVYLTPFFIKLVLSH